MNISNFEDDFEQYLKRQPIRAVPDSWRKGILTAAKEDHLPSKITKIDESAAAIPTIAGILRRWLWPSPVAWGTLAAVWVVIVTLWLAACPSDIPSEIQITKQPQPPASQIAVALAEKRQLLIELIGPVSTPEPSRERRQPSPRSELILNFSET